MGLAVESDVDSQLPHLTVVPGVNDNAQLAGDLRRRFSRCGFCRL